MVLPDSYGIPRVPQYSGSVSTLVRAFRIPGSHRLWPAFPDRSPTRTLGLATLQLAANSPTTPHAQRLQPFPRMRFRLLRFRSPLLTESRLLSLPRGTEMFHFPRFPARDLSASSCWRFPPAGSPIRTSTDPSPLTAPRGISAFAPSFFGSWRLGIHRVPFLASPILTPYALAKVLRESFRSLKTKHTPPPKPVSPKPSP